MLTRWQDMRGPEDFPPRNACSLVCCGPKMRIGSHARSALMLSHAQVCLLCMLCMGQASHAA